MIKIDCSFDYGNIAGIFENRYKQWDITFADIYHKEKNTYIIKKNGWSISFFIDASGFFEFYCSNRANGDSHFRIYEDGKIEMLEALSEGIVYDCRVPGDKEKQEKEYQRIERNLKSCGLYGLEIFVVINVDDKLDFNILKDKRFKNWDKAEKDKLAQYMKDNQLLFKPNIYVIYPTLSFEEVLDVFEFQIIVKSFDKNGLKV